MASDFRDEAPNLVDDASSGTDDPVVTLANALFAAERRAALENPARRATATYRLQLHERFRLEDVAGIVDYLHDLGISDIYLSPYLRAKPGSTHGYDVFDHGQLNPEIGDESSNRRLKERLDSLGMGRVLDVVPNHMGIAGPNPYWLDLLETGPQAPSAMFFDIDWDPVKEELEGRVLLPILGDQYGAVLESGQLRLEREGGSFTIRYYEHRLPVAPVSYELILGRRRDELFRRVDPGNQHVQEFLSILDSIQHLPKRRVLEPELVAGKLREKEVIKRRLDRLCAESPDLCRFIDENVSAFNGIVGQPETFGPLDELLEQQAYRLAYWRVAAEEINYRRFFDINDLAGVRVEDPRVFGEVHKLIFRWIDEGGITGLRIDHPDGLADPAGYFRTLQETTILHHCRRRFETMRTERGAPECSWEHVAEAIRQLWRHEVETDPTTPLARRLPVVAEKILSRGEELPTDWPIDGTVGYEFLNALNGLFVEPTSAKAFDSLYLEFTGDHDPFDEFVYEAKQLITRTALASELNMLARQLNRVSEGDRHSRDFTLNELRRMLREVIACFPIYRTYIRPDRSVSDADRKWIVNAVRRARRRNPTTDVSVFDFLRDALLLEHPPHTGERNVQLREEFVARFQQTTGPVQAKGLEDTTFYRYVRLASLNEVGGDPVRFGVSPQAFHALNSHRLKYWPGGFSTTATHDTKRGEDTRIRINVLSELPEEWKTHLARWSYWNKNAKESRDDTPVPDPREEYLLYQNLLGAWPFGGPDDAVPEGLTVRMQEYMTKAVREAKVNTSWTDADQSYVEILTQFIARILEGPDAAPFLKDFIPFQRRIARVGVVHSLAQTLLKIASPGVPDAYQGCELWDLSLVDPDNRRPVDYERRRDLLNGIRSRIAGGVSRRDLASELLAQPEDGAIKLYLLWTILNHRASEPDLYLHGTYRPLEAEGEPKSHVVAFGRGREGRYCAVVTARLVAGLMGPEATRLPIGADVWGETRLILPEAPLPHRWRELLTDTVIELEPRPNGPPTISIGELFHTLPVALLVNEPDEQGTSPGD